MMGFMIAIHIIICILLIGIILIQAGRGGGLVDGFSGVESMFGPKTNTFLTRTTTVLATLFFLTCVSLAFLSAQQSKSLMRKVKSQGQETEKRLPLAAGVVNSQQAPAAANITQAQTQEPAPATQPQEAAQAE